MARRLQAFVDESVSDEEFILGGHIATAEGWLVLSKEWEKLLPLATRDQHGNFHFKMSEMSFADRDLAVVRHFYKLIEDNVMCSVSFRMNLKEFARAQARLLEHVRRFRWNIVDLGVWANSYFVSCRMLLDNFHTSRATVKSIPPDDKVDFIFDENTKKNSILEFWDQYVDGRDYDVKAFYGAKPRFENDRQFLPLQAADLWAWWVREWYEEDAARVPDKLRNFDFGAFRGKERRLIIFTADEDELFEALLGVAALEMASGNVTQRGPFPA